MKKYKFLLSSILLAFTHASIHAQDIPSENRPSKEASHGFCPVIPALTPISIEILSTLSSKTSKSGDRFPIRLASPITINGKAFVQAGVTGIGEVVHAKKAGGMGAAGELILAARHLDVNGSPLHLRSLHLATAGKSNIGTVNAINVGSAASPIPVSMIGFFISGGQTVVQQGTVAEAKVAENFQLPPQSGDAADRSNPNCYSNSNQP